jgi:hypothetical protein
MVIMLRKDMVLIETIDHEVSAGKFWLRAGPARGAAQSRIEEKVLDFIGLRYTQNRPRLGF